MRALNIYAGNGVNLVLARIGIHEAYLSEKQRIINNCSSIYMKGELHCNMSSDIVN